MKARDDSSSESTRGGGNRTGACYWLTGLPGAGKTTLARAFHQRLRHQGHEACILDADALREGLNGDLGYSPADRHENVRRLSEVARLFVMEGFVAIVSSIAPYQVDRERARRRFAAGRYFEVFVDAPVDLCIARDPKGLYRKAQQGAAQQVTGISAPYERPVYPDLVLKTGELPAEACVDALLSHHGAQLAGGMGAVGRAVDEAFAHGTSVQRSCSQAPWRR